MERDRKDMVSTRPQDAVYLSESFLGVTDMLEHILGDDEIEGVVSIGQGLDILAGSAGRDFRAWGQPLFETGTEIAVIIPQYPAEAIVRGGVINGDIPGGRQVGN